MNLIWVVRAALLVLVSIPDLTQAVCTTARVRKSWDAYTTTEKDTYKAALAASMDSGGYIRFVEMHTEMRSEMEAHRQCMFIYWHRLMLVVFENMLRGQGPQFECVTLPYWNWLGANDRLLARQCSSLGDCSPIMSELGGWTNGTQRTLNINGIRVTGRCVRSYPLNHFCESRTLSGSACARCIIRNNWGSAPISASLSYASVREQIFEGRTIGDMSPLIERGCHNNVHSSLPGCMDVLVAPSDPLFVSHHVMIDVLHTIFHKCRVGTQRLTFAQKASHPVAWTSCAKRNGGVFRPTDVITMRTGVRGGSSVPGRQDPIIGRYFTDVPTQYAALMNTRDLGRSSYTYELSGQLADMYTNCDGNSGPEAPTTGNQRRLNGEYGWSWDGDEDKNTRKSSCDDVSDSTSVLQSGDDVSDSTSVLQSGVDVVAANATASKAISFQFDCNNDNDLDVITLVTKSHEEELVCGWYDKTMANMGGQCPDAMADLERQACMFQEVCLGGVTKFSHKFQATWGVKEPRCLTIVKAIKCGEQKITYKNWRKHMESHFGCPKPANATRFRCSTKNH